MGLLYLLFYCDIGHSLVGEEENLGHGRTQSEFVCQKHCF